VSVGDDFDRSSVLARFERETLPKGARPAFRWKRAQ